VLKRIQDLVQSINSDPAKLARASKVVKIARHRYAQSLAFWQKFKPLYVRKWGDRSSCKTETGARPLANFSQALLTSMATFPRSSS
jgi:hypothetical protein